VVDVYEDDDTSAYKAKKRTHYQRLCDDLQGGAIDAVICWAADRLHRSLKELEHFIDIIEATGAEVAMVTGGDYDLTTPNGRMTARVLGSVARRESEAKAERLLEKHAELVEAGLPNGGPRLYGYQRIGSAPAKKGDPDTRELVIDPKESDVVREVFDRVGRSETLTRIADGLNSRGLRTSTGKPWTIWGVRRMALNGFYAGVRVRNGNEEEVKGGWPKVVKEAEWRRAMALLNAPDRPQRRAARRYLLSGAIATCGACGKPLRSKQQHYPTGNAPVYACRPPKQGGCGGVTIRARPLEELVAEAVFDVVEPPAFAKSLQRRAGGDRKAAAAVTKLEAELAGWEKAAASGSLTPREYVKFRDSTLKRLGDARARLGGDVASAAVGRFAGRPGALREWWQTATLDQRQAALRAVVERVVVSPATTFGRRFDQSRVQIIYVA
jgi:DNA invertase Pin-like site-specific DNA recombinase